MAKISDLADFGTAQDGDQVPVVRAGATGRSNVGDLLAGALTPLATMQAHAEASFATLTAGQWVTTFAPADPAAGDSTAPRGYALFNKAAQNTGAPRPIATISGSLKNAASFDVLVAMLTAVNTLEEVDRFTISPRAAGAQVFVAGIDYAARDMPSGAFLGAFVPISGTDPGLAVKSASGAGWLYFDCDPEADPQVYSEYPNELQLTATLIPAISDIVTAEAAAARKAAFAATQIMPRGVGVERELLGPADLTPTTDAAEEGTRRTLIQDLPTLGGVAEEFSFFIRSLLGAKPTIDVGWELRTADNSFRTLYRQTVTPHLGRNDLLSLNGDFPAWVLPAGARPFVSVPASNLAMLGGLGEQAGALTWYVDATDPGQPGDPAVTYNSANGYAQAFSVIVRRPAPASPPNGERAIKPLLDASSFAGSTLPAGWTATNGWTVNGGLISPPNGQGYGAVAYSNKMFALAERTSTDIFQFTAGGSAIGVGWRGAGTSFADTEGSMVVVDMVSNSLILKSMWNAAQNGSDPGTQATVAVPWQLVTGRNYQLVKSIVRRVNRYTLLDTVTGESISIADDPRVGIDNYNTVTGEQIGCLCYLALAGQFTVSRFEVRSDYSAPALWIGGDSLTQRLGVPEAAGFAGLLRDDMRARGQGVAISGLTSDYSNGGVRRLASEVIPLAPRLALFMFGTNDQDGGLANYQAQAVPFHDQCVAAGITPVFEMPAPCSGHSFAAMHAWLLSTGWRLFRSDLALTINNDGATQDPTLFQSDRIHRNADGHARLMLRVPIDLAELA